MHRNPISFEFVQSLKNKVFTEQAVEAEIRALEYPLRKMYIERCNSCEFTVSCELLDCICPVRWGWSGRPNRSRIISCHAFPLYIRISGTSRSQGARENTGSTLFFLLGNQIFFSFAIVYARKPAEYGNQHDRFLSFCTL